MILKLHGDHARGGDAPVYPEVEPLICCTRVETPLAHIYLEACAEKSGDSNMLIRPPWPHISMQRPRRQITTLSPLSSSMHLDVNPTLFERQSSKDAAFAGAGELN